MDDALATIYTAHVTIQKLRHDRALMEGKFDHAVIFSGALIYQLFDDMPYPFKPNPHFKCWVPVTDNPNCFIVFTPNPEPVLNSLHWDRAWKTEYEIECLRRANERGARGHVAAERAFRDGASEFEIHVDYLRAADHAEEELPYGNIIALNEN